MVDHTKFTTQLLEKIGAPLLGAVNEVSVVDAATESEAATKTAQLLALSVQMSTSLYNALQIQEDETQADSTRLALTALASPLIANYYAHHKQVPSEDSIKQMNESLQAVLNFADNFSPASEQQSRLQTIGQDTVLFDVNQSALVTIQAMVPVISAVEEFSFGQGHRKLVQDISNRLGDAAADIVKRQGGGDKLQELIVFKSLADLYAGCHRAETKRVLTLDDQDRGTLLTDPVWESFEVKRSMVEVLIGIDAPDTVLASDASSPSSQETTSKSDIVVEEAPVQASPAVAGGSPMGFFKKQDDDNEPEVAQAPISEAAPVATAPPATASQEQSESPPTSPMGFFKPGAKKKDSDDDNA